MRSQHADARAKHSKMDQDQRRAFSSRRSAASFLLSFERPTFKAGALLAIAVRPFCRFYYFAFYVIKHYAGPRFRFARLSSFVKYLVSPQADLISNSSAFCVSGKLVRF
jgi:hypothetical protein